MRTSAKWLVVTMVVTGLVAMGVVAVGAEKAKVQVYSHWDPDQFAGMQILWKDYMKQNPNVQIEPINVGGLEKLRLMYSAKMPPETWALNAVTLPIEVDRGNLVDLTPFTERDKVDFSGYYAGLKEMVTYKGKIWALPQGLGTEMMVYNADMFDEAGVAGLPGPGRNPITLEELVDVAKKLTKRDAQGKLLQLGLQNIQSWGMLGWQAQLYEEDGYWDPKAEKYNVTKPGIIKLWQLVQDTAYKHRVARGGFSSDVEANEALGGGWLFAKGKAAMQFNVSWALGGWLDEMKRGNLAFDWRHAQLPKGTYRVTPVYFDTDVISAGAKNIQAAWDYLKWSHTKPGPYMKLAEANSRIPVFKDLWDEYWLSWIKRGLPATVDVEVLGTMLRSGRLVDYMGGVPAVFDPDGKGTAILQKYALKLWANEKPAKELLTEAQAELDKYIVERKKEIQKGNK